MMVAVFRAEPTMVNLGFLPQHCINGIGEGTLLTFMPFLVVHLLFSVPP